MESEGEGEEYSHTVKRIQRGWSGYGKGARERGYSHPVRCRAAANQNMEEKRRGESDSQAVQHKGRKAGKFKTWKEGWRTRATHALLRTR
jgi:hypothetical protein